MQYEDLRRELAAALRWAAREGLHEGVDNHFSVAVPDANGEVRGDLFLINPYRMHWSQVTASSLVLCDKEGRVLEGERGVEETAFCIHSRIHLGKPTAVAALHTHMPYATALAHLEGGRLEMCGQTASCSTAAWPTTMSSTAWRWTPRRGTASPRNWGTWTSSSWAAMGCS